MFIFNVNSRIEIFPTTNPLLTSVGGTPNIKPMWHTNNGVKEIKTITKTQSLGKPYKYHLRPGYGSDKLLLEFLLASTDTEFDKDLFAALKDINPKVDTVEDLWMNDEVLIHVSSDKGTFTLSKDIYDFAFIMAENNQPCIILIDEILNSSNHFLKEQVNFEDYKNLKT